MIIGLQGSETVVNRLRLNAATSDAALARLRLASLLQDAPLHPVGLSPAAIVFIRRLYDPLPGALRLDQSGGHLPERWDQAARESLEKLVSGAARPALGAVSTSANAVVFLDRSELLACLATDWCQGSVTTRWWWLSLLRQASASQIVKELWRKTPEYVPAALQQLAKANSATTFVSSFSDAEARSLLHDVARSFGLYAITSALDSFAGPAPQSFVENDATSTARGISKKGGETEAQPEAVSSLDAPWAHCVPETIAAELRPEQQSFLGISLMLQRAPTRVRAADFARAVEDWRRRITLADSQGLVLPDGSERHESERHRPLVEVSDSDEDDVTTAPLNKTPSGPPEHSQKLAPPDLDDVTTETDAQVTQSRSRIQPIVEVTAEFAAVETEESLVISLAEPVDMSSDPLDLSTVKDAEVSSLDQFAVCEAQTETEFGGLFYLINLAIYLGFYGDFTTPAEPGIELNIWDFVALLGRELVGKPLQDDPLWHLLAQLAAREEDEEPGRDFEPEDEWRVPPEWLSPFLDEGTLSWSVAARRLRLFHSCGFLLLDIPQHGNAREQLRREMEPYESFEFRVPSFALERHSALSRELETRNSKLGTRYSRLETWLERLTPYVRARLRKAFALTTSEDAVTMICRQRARVSATATHVDVFFSLAELPIEIRLAGLDRDPGWVPSAGRFVTFHFE